LNNLRYDLLRDEYVIIAPNRLHRPDMVYEIKTKYSKICPFCPGNENFSEKDILKFEENGKWVLRVVPNKFRSLAIENPYYFKEFEAGAYGAHEIIIDTFRHIKFFEFEKKEFINLFKAIKLRYIDLKKDCKLKYFICFKNEGIKAGATQPHPHTQILALPLIPINKLKEIERYKAFFEENGKTIFEKYLEIEDLVIFENNEFKALLPKASKFAFEIRIIRKKGADFSEEKLSEVFEYLKIMPKIIGEFDFNIVFNFPPLQENSEWFNFNIEFIPRLFNIAGGELSGIYTNVVAPEKAKKAFDDFGS
jgi:UDPglucose--hexose-1-phosphate uridylyltransferase